MLSCGLPTQMVPTLLRVATLDCCPTQTRQYRLSLFPLGLGFEN